jgi:hypothetical protein
MDPIEIASGRTVCLLTCLNKKRFVNSNRIISRLFTVLLLLNIVYGLQDGLHGWHKNPRTSMTERQLFMRSLGWNAGQGARLKQIQTFGEGITLERLLFPNYSYR